MELRGVEFGRVFNASGARNFLGHDAWWFHRFFDLHYKGCTFVTKTATLKERNGFSAADGFMPLVEGTTTPKERVPKCIRVYPVKKVVLNKVGLSGPGIKWLMREGSWQANVEPFVISIMAIAKTKEERLDEIRKIAECIAEDRSNFCAPFAIQKNDSCPNVGHEQDELVEESGESLDILEEVLPGVPKIAKWNALLDTKRAVQMSQHPFLDAACMGNTILWDHLPKLIDRKKLFGTDKSPLAGLGGDPGGGGLSGAPLLPIIFDWIHQARWRGFKKPIIACGGILHPRDVQHVQMAGASAIEIGSASILRPWRVQSIIDEGNKVFA